jgi:hypothetical protein
MPVRVQDFRECAKTGACAYVDSWVTASVNALASCSSAPQAVATALNQLTFSGSFYTLAGLAPYTCKKTADPSGKEVPCADGLTTTGVCGLFGVMTHNAGMKREGHPMNFASPQMAQQYCASLGAKVAWARPWQDFASAQRLAKATLGPCGGGDCTLDKLSYMKKNYLDAALRWSGLSLGKAVKGDALGFWQVFMELVYGADTISLNAIADAPLPTGLHVDPFRASWYCYRDLPAQCP